MIKQENFSKKKEVFSFLIVLAALAVIYAIPYASSDLAAGHDGTFHVLRIEGLAEALRSGGSWPQRVYGLLCGGYGYAVGLFYPDIFLLPAALLRMVCLGPELAFKFQMLLFALLASVSGYLAGRGIGKSHMAGLLVMILYSLCQYHLGNLYIRSAMGEVQAMAFVPLVFWGLYNFTEENATKPWILCLGMTGVLLSHTISLALCGLLAVVWCVLRRHRLLDIQSISHTPDGAVLLTFYPRKLRYLIGAAAVCLLLGAWYWVPLLEQFASDTFRVSTKPLTNLAGENLTWEIFTDPTSFRGIGLLGIAMWGCGLVLVIRQKEQPRYAKKFWIAGTVICLLPLLPREIWGLLDLTPLTSIQFPWRLFLLGQFCLCLACALFLAPMLEQMKHPHFVIGAIFAVAAAGALLLYTDLPELVNYPANWFTQDRGETFYLGGGSEWVPDGAGLSEFVFEENAQYTDANGSHTGSYNNAESTFTFVYEGTPGAIGIPKMYYKGYSAWYEDGTPIELHKDGAGRVELTIPEDLPAGGVVTVAYTGTTAQHVADWVSLLTLPALAGWCLLRQKRQKNKR